MTVAEQAPIQLERRKSNLPASASQNTVDTQVRQRLSECAYSYYFRDVTIHCAAGVVTLRGRVPTFYMKQMAQALLNAVEGVSRINNRLDVVSASGLSSVRPR